MLSCYLILLLSVVVSLIHLPVVELYLMLTVEPWRLKHWDWHIHHSPVVRESSPPWLPPILKILTLLPAVRVVSFSIIKPQSAVGATVMFEGVET